MIVVEQPPRRSRNERSRGRERRSCGFVGLTDGMVDALMRALTVIMQDERVYGSPKTSLEEARTIRKMLHGRLDDS